MAENNNDSGNLALQKLEDYIADQEQGKNSKPPDFTPEEIITLRRVITLVNGLTALGSFADFIKSTIIWIGVVVGALIAIKNGAIEFILNAVNGK